MAFKKFIETKRVFRFLQGLHEDFDSVRSRLLGTKPFPTLNSVFSEVRLEESRIRVMMSHAVHNTESSALSVQTTTEDTKSVSNPSTNTNPSSLAVYRGSGQGGKPYCKHCKRSGHSYDNCYSRPDAKVQRLMRFSGNNWRNNRWKSSNNDHWRNNGSQGTMAQLTNQIQSEMQGTNPPLQQQIDTIMKLLEQQLEKTSTNSVATMAHTGNIGMSEHIDWIVDSGASDHMTHNKKILTNYVLFTIPKFVEVATGFKTYILGKGDVILNNGIKLLNVLHIPNLQFHLISVRRFTMDNKCFASFSPSEVLFQGTTQGEKIGSASIHNGPYLFGTVLGSRNLCCVAKPKVDAGCSTSCSDNYLLLWHRRLGHPSFAYLRKIMPNLFLNVDMSCITCEVCVLAKQTKAMYPAKQYVPSHAFNLIHSNIWGLSRVSNINGSRWFILFVDDHIRITWVFLMKHKSDAGGIIRNFITFIQTQFNIVIKTIRTDNGLEYLDKDIQNFLITRYSS